MGAALFMAVTSASAAQAQAAGKTASPAIPLEKFTLPNGLKVVLSEDHSAPIVTVYTTYKVGAAQEKQGFTGFAHLFEHMMFNGSRNVPEGAYAYYVDGTGGFLNGNTEPDRTNYFQTVPSNYLEGVLYLESNRMANLIIDETSLANEKDVVKEEVRQQQENSPFAKTILLEWPGAAFSSWEYSHSIYGSMEDLSNAPVQSFKDFFAEHYVPNNATLVIVGDFEAAEARALVERYYSPLPRGPENKRVMPVEPEQTEAVYRAVTDPLAPVPMALISFDIPPPREADRDALELLASVLTSGASARLTKRLVDDDKLASGVIMRAGFPIPTYGPGQLATILVAANGKQLEDVRAAFWDELERVQKQGVSAAELKRGKAKLYKEHVDSLGKTLFKAMQLATYETFHGGAERFQGDARRYDAIKTRDLKRVANEYLTRARSVTFDINPPSGAAVMPGV